MMNEDKNQTEAHPLGHGPIGSGGVAGGVGMSEVSTGQAVGSVAGSAQRRLSMQDMVRTKEAEQPHDIGWAVKKLIGGDRVARRSWNGKNMFLRLRQNSVAMSDDGFFRGVYVEMKTADNCLVPWLCSQTDLLASDWHLV